MDKGQINIKQRSIRYSEGELKRINSCTDDMPVNISRILYLLQNLGIRANEIIYLEKDNLSKLDEDIYILKYYLSKHSIFEEISITKDIVAILQEAIKDSDEEYGKECKYMFPENKEKPISINKISYFINKALDKNKVLDDKGNPLKINIHLFRRTLISNHIKNSI